MGLHDRLAHTAYLNGRRAHEFATAAQRNANGFWFYLIAAGLVWWLANGKWWLIAAALGAWSMLRSFSATMIQSRLEKMEERYGAPVSAETSPTQT